ncbi:MAG TPA: amidase, partial [Paenirhodobacter sp.]
MLERFWTAAQQGRAIAAGDLDPVDITEAYLEAASEAPDVYARLTATRARGEAMAARERARAGLLRGPLDGVPISWK